MCSKFQEKKILTTKNKIKKQNKQQNKHKQFYGIKNKQAISFLGYRKLNILAHFTGARVWLYKHLRSCADHGGQAKVQKTGVNLKVHYRSNTVECALLYVRKQHGFTLPLSFCCVLLKRCFRGAAYTAQTLRWSVKLL